MKILIVGSGAREHAIAKTLAKSKHKPEIFCYGSNKNPGILKFTSHYYQGNVCDTHEVLKKALEWEIELAVIGPEAPLEQGLSDILWDHNIATIGPKKQLAKLETSKAFTRDLLKKYQIPGSPIYRRFVNLENVSDFLHQLGEGRYVIKADGLMGGKGVKVAGDHLHSFAEAYAFCQELYQGGHSFLIEEKVIGQEFSLLYFCDGNSLIAMPIVQDHKRVFINDEGPNTGGMGSYSDVNHSLPFLTEKDLHQAQHINESVITALTKEYRQKYIGILYSSFMVTKNGVRLIEYNARFGDPEAMNVLAVLETDLVDIFSAMVSGHLTSSHVKFANLATVCKYAVPEGYPDQPIKNSLIDISSVSDHDLLYYASIDEVNGKLIATGSRAVAAVGVAGSIAEAEKIAEKAISQVQGKLFHRADIGTDALIERRIQHMRELRV